jgi:hypothetical protein
MESIGSRFDWEEVIRVGRLDGETFLYLGSGGAVDYGAAQTAGTPRSISMKSGRTIGAVARHTAGAAMMLAVAAAAYRQVEFGRNQKDRSKATPEQDD